MEHIGTLAPYGDYWRLVYDRCDHDQVFARLGLEEPERAIREVHRRYATCLTCRLEALLGQ